MPRSVLSTIGSLAAVAALALAGFSALLPAAPAAASEESTTTTQARPLLKVPFPCHQEWRGVTFAGHERALAIDFNQGSGDSDLGRPVKASAAGTVSTARFLSGQGFGEYVIINHGGGWQTVYAHLQRGSTTVSVGDRVSATTTIGRVGKTGLVDSTSHLHYEQRLNGDDVRIVFGRSNAVQYYATDYFTRTSC
ncbi:M23 family metallopeptidase [Auraticoccus monumenti]|uniref:Peptidase family M23 n=1 Tax=Auraticoccus monumenti TaxID=675864 RepID=A0A1G6TEX3_9ACTN|nr:M23 family metallopeptidase [Auraticoccus monumenti]SDD27630.1 Peptidase family M23 [Auraticoccus monumenti]